MRILSRCAMLTTALFFATALPAEAQTTHSVTLSWTASTTAGVSYNVYRSGVAGGPYTLQNSVPLSTTTLTYVDSTVAAGTTYFYVARAVLNGVESVNSNEVTVSIPPAPPTSLKVVSIT